MNTIRSIQKLNQRELEEGVNPEASWHTDYRDTAFVSVGGLPFELSEGDIITLFSQYGEPTWIKLARDKETGKSRGFCWIKYEDQRSTDLAVDNLGGATVMGRVLRVDHARYKPRDDEDMRDNTMGDVKLSDDEDEGRRKRRRTDSESDSEEDRPPLPEEIQLAKLIREIDDEDPMKPSMIKDQKERVDVAIKKYKKSKKKERKHHHSRRHHRGHSKERRRSGDDRDRRRIKEGADSDHESEPRRRESSRDRHRDQLPERSRAKVERDREGTKDHRERRRDTSTDRKRHGDRDRDRDCDSARYDGDRRRDRSPVSERPSKTSSRRHPRDRSP
ncbi:hypothetical protein BCR34DRAFT_467781, partial [Clohesyomyces aquaticus]